MRPEYQVALFNALLAAGEAYDIKLFGGRAPMPCVLRRILALGARIQAKFIPRLNVGLIGLWLLIKKLISSAKQQRGTLL